MWPRPSGTFERTLLSGNSAYDRYKAGSKTAMTPAQIRGMECHEGINLTPNAYANLGVGTDKPNPDVGRFEVTKDPLDWGKFKTPTLPDISRTGPDMHDGSLKTLDEVVDY
jgi:cytochrome c peroxidase